MSLMLAMSWMEKLIAFAVLMQTSELLQLRPQWNDSGVWSWPILRQDYTRFPAFLRRFFDLVLSANSFHRLLRLRMIAALALLIVMNLNWTVPVLFFLLTFSTWLIALRWRGTFNGGSDYMTFIVLFMLSFATLGYEKLTKACLWYIAIQVCLSFFISGLVKINKKSWQDGRALSEFLKATNYQIPEIAQALAESRFFCFFGAWFIVLFEVSFPLALLNKNIAIAYIATAMIFHVFNFYTFGLNRFIFAWAAAYPALYFCSRTLA